ncbi:response regulator [Pseudobacteriovorax antillogorgiicola]|uniref:Two-component system, chemotaxis family, response regulator CheY n=1 Tax=Pseudobacteriovorax antillogorgiicola TaxID=1513793 RepID=A0A1Y6BBP2_9BACT|nr:response regulator [Pseudobacteriovorax antillogorgiicola]TCS57418.1 two-component system chemotaxis response regulator CheY [Pseudobacteriovorax antillogorgiicola]SMF01391.1 two-component system, chemotaxis family, response regulator CheY [Pseudobacteriovorax antillogorgiicola]
MPSSDGKLRILIVDDSPTIRKNLVQTLESFDFDVVAAADGEEGVSHVAKDHGIDMVITDVHMPKLDGIEMTQKIVSQGFNKPIVVLTQERRDEFVQKARAAGATGWMVKPFHRDEVISVVRHALKLSA